MVNRLPFEMKPQETRTPPPTFLKIVGRAIAAVFWAALIFLAMAVVGLWLFHRMH
jgi:hypothetical protein